MGPSGSGKTTLLSIVGGLKSPDEGECHRMRSLSVAWVLQTVNVLTNRSALDNAMLGGYQRGLGITDARSKAKEVLKRVGLAELQHKRSGRLSGGERQRLVVARALMAEPQLLLADEPTAQLDADNSELVLDSILANLDFDGAVLIATHDEAVAQRCSRTIRLRHGFIDTNG